MRTFLQNSLKIMSYIFLIVAGVLFATMIFGIGIFGVAAMLMILLPFFVVTIIGVVCWLGYRAYKVNKHIERINNGK